MFYFKQGERSFQVTVLTWNVDGVDVATLATRMKDVYKVVTMCVIILHSTLALISGTIPILSSCKKSPTMFWAFYDSPIVNIMFVIISLLIRLGVRGGEAGTLLHGHPHHDSLRPGETRDDRVSGKQMRKIASNCRGFEELFRKRSRDIWASSSSTFSLHNSRARRRM